MRKELRPPDVFSSTGAEPFRIIPSSTMHQGHNIPWEIIENNLEFKENNKHYTPAVTGLFSRKRPNSSKEVTHFVSRFVHTIRLFSETERAKYPTREKIELISEGKIYSDQVLKKYPEYLDAANQRIENWILRAKKKGYDGQDIISYDTRDGDLADVVKILLHENEIQMLLMLAKHPKIPLSSLHNLSWGHWFGFSRVKESALSAYLFFNSAEATGILEDGRYARSHLYPNLLRELGTTMDYPAQQIPHQEFFRSYGILKGGGILCGDSANDIYVHQNRELLKEYMKTLFSLMYRYDVIVRECGLEPSWEKEIGYTYPINEIIRTKSKWVEEKQEMVYELV